MNRPEFVQRSERQQFKIGKYDILAQPVAGAAHMLRYTVLLNGKRLGAMLSMPSESNCKNLENPPVVPPPKFLSVTYRPGRPKKGAPRPNNDTEETSRIPWTIK
jgi:hypothetical protein